jgi:hypothetical protein
LVERVDAEQRARVGGRRLVQKEKLSVNPVAMATSIYCAISSDLIISVTQKSQEGMLPSSTVSATGAGILTAGSERMTRLGMMMAFTATNMISAPMMAPTIRCDLFMVLSPVTLATK